VVERGIKVGGGHVVERGIKVGGGHVIERGIQVGGSEVKPEFSLFVSVFTVGVVRVFRLFRSLP
jgi:hypothetical protein